MQGYLEAGKSLCGLFVVKTRVHLTRHCQHRRHRQVAVQRSVLGDEGDPLQGVERAGLEVTENAYVASRRLAKAHGAVQKRRLPGSVRSHERRDTARGHRHRAVAKRPDAAVGLGEAGGLENVHAAPSPLWRPPRRAGRASSGRSRKSRNAAMKSATVPCSSRPAVAASFSQPETRLRRSSVSSRSPTVSGATSTKVPCPGRPAMRPFCSRSR